MDSSRLALARDCLYAASLLGGGALGLLIAFFVHRRDSSRAARAFRRVSASLVFAAALASLTTSFVASEGRLFSDTQLLIASAPFALCALVGVLFPRLFGFPLCVAACSAIVLFAWAFLVFPDARDSAPLGRFRVDTSGGARFWFGPEASPSYSVSVADASRLSFSALEVVFDRRMPLVGSTVRVALLEVRAGDVFVAGRSRRSLLELVGEPSGRSFPVVPGVSRRAVHIALPASTVSGGSRVDIEWNGGDPRFKE